MTIREMINKLESEKNKLIVENKSLKEEVVKLKKEISKLKRENIELKRINKKFVDDWNTANAPADVDKVVEESPVVPTDENDKIIAADAEVPVELAGESDELLEKTEEVIKPKRRSKRKKVEEEVVNNLI